MVRLLKPLRVEAAVTVLVVVLPFTVVVVAVGPFKEASPFTAAIYYLALVVVAVVEYLAAIVVEFVVLPYSFIDLHFLSLKAEIICFIVHILDLGDILHRDGEDHTSPATLVLA